MPTAIGIAVAGALGALARYGLEGLVSRKAPSAFPWGTFVVNISGALVVGFLFTGRMKIEGQGKLLRIYVGESDRWHGKPLYQAIVERVRKEGLAGATAIRGIEGFGADSRLHTSRILRLSEDLPVLIEIADTAERIERIFPLLDEMVTEGLVTLENVDIIAYRSSSSSPGGTGE